MKPVEPVSNTSAILSYNKNLHPKMNEEKTDTIDFSSKNCQIINKYLDLAADYELTGEVVMSALKYHKNTDWPLQKIMQAACDDWDIS